MSTNARVGARWIFAAAAGLFIQIHGAAAQKLESADTALLRLDRPSGATIGARFAVGSREFKYADTELSTDLVHVLARAGGNVFPFLNLWGEAGWVRAEADPGETGEGGLEWAVGADAKLLEYVIKGSPVVERKEAFSLGLSMDYRGLESNFEERDFGWNEFRVGPMIAYTRDFSGEIRRSYQPSGMAARLGVLYLNADGEYGEDDIEENRDFAFACGFDLLGESGWVTRFGFMYLGSQEREFSLAAMYNF